MSVPLVESGPLVSAANLEGEFVTSSPAEIHPAVAALAIAGDPLAAIEPVHWNFDAPNAPPSWLVEGLITRGAISMVSGDTGTGKSFLSLSLAVAIARQEQWLGREVFAGSTLYVDEENPKGVVRARLRALGMTNDHAERLAYYSREGLIIGTSAHTEWLAARVERHRADLVVIDTVAAATAAQINDNDEVVALYRQLRPIAAARDCAIVLLHHERKQQLGQSRSAGQSMMGARQWAAQADAHFAVRLVDSSREELENGQQRLTTTLQLEQPKSRDGVPIRREQLVIESVMEAGALLSTEVRSDGEVESKQSEVGRLLEDAIELLASQGEMRKSDLAAKLGRTGKDGTLERALGEGLADGRLERPRYGFYAAAVVDTEPVV